MCYEAQYFYEGIKENEDIPTFFSSKTKSSEGDIQKY